VVLFRGLGVQGFAKKENGVIERLGGGGGVAGGVEQGDGENDGMVYEKKKRN